MRRSQSCLFPPLSLSALVYLRQLGSAVELNEALSYLERSYAIDPYFDNFDRIAEPLFLALAAEGGDGTAPVLNVALMYQSKLHCRTRHCHE